VKFIEALTAVQKHMDESESPKDSARFLLGFMIGLAWRAGLTTAEIRLYLFGTEAAQHEARPFPFVGALSAFGRCDVCPDTPGYRCASCGRLVPEMRT